MFAADEVEGNAVSMRKFCQIFHYHQFLSVPDSNLCKLYHFSFRTFSSFPIFSTMKAIRSIFTYFIYCLKRDRYVTEEKENLH